LKDGIPRILQLHPEHHGVKIIFKPAGKVSGIKRKAPDEDHITLGFFLAGDGSSKFHKR
jgi:hypothetical protein